MKYRRFRSMSIVLALGLAGAGLPAMAHAADLEVTASHVAPGPGSIRFVLYRGAEGFRHEDRAFRILSARAGPGSASVHFQDVPPGRYAVMAYHDANDDRKLDLRFGMFPKEGWGLSNDPRVMGPPGFTPSSFAMDDSNRSIMIEMHY